MLPRALRFVVVCWVVCPSSLGGAKPGELLWARARWPRSCSPWREEFWELRRSRPERRSEFLPRGPLHWHGLPSNIQKFEGPRHYVDCRGTHDLVEVALKKRNHKESLMQTVNMLGLFCSLRFP